MNTVRILMSAAVLIASCAGQADKPSPFPSKNKKVVVDPPPPTKQKADSDPSESRSRSAPSKGGGRVVDSDGSGDVGTACYYNPKSKGGDATGADRKASVLEGVHATYASGTRVKVTNLENHKSVVVTISGHTELGDRIIGVSKDAAEQLGFVRMGTAQVKLEVVRN